MQTSYHTVVILLHFEKIVKDFDRTCWWFIKTPTLRRRGV